MNIFTTLQKIRFFNYIGQLRVYSLIDFIILLFAIKASFYLFIGAIFLHIGFILYLEEKHAHSYRRKFPHYSWAFISLLGVLFYLRIEALFFIIASFLYTQKSRSLAPISPLFRGLQSMFLVAGIIGYTSPLTWITFSVLFVRNVLGDLRDVEKDKKEGMKTLPIILGFKKSVPRLHLIVTLLTTCIWWSYTDLSIITLVISLLLELGTYYLTPR